MKKYKIVACDDKKPSGVKVTSEQWNKSMEKLANKGKITAANISSSLKDGEETGGEETGNDETTPTYEQLVMTSGGVKIAQKTQIKNNKNKFETIEFTAEVCEDWEVQYTSDLKAKMVTIKEDNNGTQKTGCFGLTALKKANNNTFMISIDLDDSADKNSVEGDNIKRDWGNTNADVEKTTTYGQLSDLFDELKTLGNKVGDYYKDGLYEIKFAYSEDDPFVLETDENYETAVAGSEISGVLKITFGDDEDVKRLVVDGGDMKFDLNISFQEKGAKSKYKFLPIAD